MKRKARLCSLIFLMILSHRFISQNEGKKWYFGTNAGLDFATNPPTVLTNGMLVSYESCGSISDALGNLLFYNDGITVWNRLHLIMANGTGLMGNPSASQSGMIVKQPGNTNLYYIFTVAEYGNTNGLRYSVVDMNLASGNGSVTIKNALLHTPSSEKITAVLHCNGTDIWIVSHDWNSNNFRCYLLTATGITATPVLSGIGSIHTIVNNAPFAAVGCMKASPNGKKLGLAIYWGPTSFELYDFDNTTGVVSNSLSLGSNYASAYGCEFSPDGSKFYGTIADINPPKLIQWDLCAGAGSLIVASQYSVLATRLGQMQRAPDGKIYIARGNGGTGTYGALGVINNPNQVGSLCGFVDAGQSIAPSVSQYGLPNMPLIRRAPQPFTYSGSSCSTYTFNAPVNPSACVAAGFSLTSLSWNFGDPSSGTNNISSLNNPIHTYNSPGTYTVQLTLNYSCGGGSDVITKVITSGSGPIINVTGKLSICKGETTTLTATGANSYIWNTGSSTSTIVPSATATAIYTVTGTNTTNLCQASKVVTVTVKICEGLKDYAGGSSLKIYPNPGNDFLTFEADADVSLMLYNEIGSLVFESSLQKGNHLIDIVELKNGVYMFKASDASGTRFLRFIKAN